MMNGSMEWSARDFVSRYTSQSSRNSSPERDPNWETNIKFTPSPDRHSYDLLFTEKKFCNRDNIDQSIAYLNQVSQSLKSSSYIIQELIIQISIQHTVQTRILAEIIFLLIEFAIVIQNLVNIYILPCRLTAILPF